MMRYLFYYWNLRTYGRIWRGELIFLGWESIQFVVQIIASLKNITGWKTLDWHLICRLSSLLCYETCLRIGYAWACFFFFFRVVTGWKRELSRSKQIKLIQQSYLTFETENFSCPVSCLTWKSRIVSSFSSFSRFALFCFFRMGFTFRVSQGQRKANEYWSLNKEMIKNLSKIYQVIFLKFQN